MAQALDDDELAAYIALVAAGDLMQRSVSAQLAEHALSPLQFAILATLLDRAEGMRMRELADRMVISRSGLTYQVTQLEAQGLVARSNASDDDRGVEVTLAPAGRTRVLAALPGHVSLVRSVFLDAVAPEQLTPLRATLEQVVQRLRARPHEKRSVSGPAEG